MFNDGFIQGLSSENSRCNFVFQVVHIFSTLKMVDRWLPRVMVCTEERRISLLYSMSTQADGKEIWTSKLMVKSSSGAFKLFIGINMFCYLNIQEHF